MNALSFGVAALLVVMSVDALGQGKKLTGPEIKATFSGNKIAEKNNFGEYIVEFKPNGTLIVWHGKYKFDQGKWRVLGNRYCRKLTLVTSGVEGCFNVTIDGAKVKFWRPDGSEHRPGASYVLMN